MKAGHFQKLLETQLASVDRLRSLAFDDSAYEEWRLETGKALDEIFGRVEQEQHPCTKAFMIYKIPGTYTATREEMQEYYENILGYQADLLGMYVEDMKDGIIKTAMHSDPQ